MKRSILSLRHGLYEPGLLDWRDRVVLVEVEEVVVVVGGEGKQEKSPINIYE